jgi:pimeloyl-ACP methyl ester carboxylesterase
MSCLFFLATAACAAEHVMTSGPLTLRSEGSFFVGGIDRHDGSLNGLDSGPPSAREGTITTGQMYVQYQIPFRETHVPVVLIHGGSLSGQSYETTPDGRMGWAEYFVRSGRSTYVVDQVGRARSGFDATTENKARLGLEPATELPSTHIIGHEFAWTWFRIGPSYGVPFKDTQFPLDAVDQFYKMWIPDQSSALPPDNPSYADLAKLGEKLGGAVLIGHSQSMMFPEQAALIDPAAVKGIISLESGYSCQTQYTDEQRTILAKIPILIVFADHQGDAPEPFRTRWTSSLDECRSFAATIAALGGDVTFIHLPEIGIHGNSHMMMLDRNNLQIANLLIDWIDTHVEKRRH